MSMREEIYSALWALVYAIPGFVTKSRRTKLWSKVPPHQQPALFMEQFREIPESKQGLPTKWIFNVRFRIYVHAASDNDVPAIKLNEMIDALHEALKPNVSTGVCTLGGLVTSCYTVGETKIDDGSFDGQAVAIVPYEILVTK